MRRPSWTAVAAKLTAQRQFVLWWDGQEKQRGGVSDRKRHLHQLGKDGLPDRLVIHRWRARLKDVGRFQATLVAAQARCLKVVESYRGGLPENARSLGTGEMEWYTPSQHMAAARDVLGAIDLDPASSEIAQRTVRAARYFTQGDDGLRHDWPGRVWLNPPYTQPLLMHFVEKLVVEYTAGRTQEAILLTHNYSDTAWFHLAARAASGICFTRGRIAFERADGLHGRAHAGPDVFLLRPAPRRVRGALRGDWRDHGAGPPLARARGGAPGRGDGTVSARSRIEALLEALSGRGPWCWDRALSLLLDAAVLDDEAA